MRRGTSGCHFTETALSKCSSSPIRLKLSSTSNNLILESKEAETKYFPSGENETDLIIILYTIILTSLHQYVQKFL
jgi:hypothetical protein